MILVERKGHSLKLTHDFQPEEIIFLRSLPVRSFDPNDKSWSAPLVKGNLEALRGTPIKVVFSPEARDLIDNGHKKPQDASVPAVEGLPAGFRFKTQSRPYQLEALTLMRGRAGFALSLPPGSGKSKLYIEDIECCFLEGHIDHALFLVPNSIKKNIVDEIEKHASIPFDTMIYAPHRRAKIEAWMKSARPPQKIRMLVMGIESLSSDSGLRIANAFLSRPGVGFYLDESSRVKTHSTNRTKAAIKLAQKAAVRRIGSGTMILKGLVDSWAQYQIVDPSIFSQSFFAFRNRYAKMGGFKAKQVVGDQNLDEFIEITRPFTYCRTKREILPDLPEKIPQTLVVEMTPEQRRLYDDLKNLGLVTTESGKVSYTNALVRELRLQQITGGFIGGEVLGESPDGGLILKGRASEIPGGNPKFDAIEDFLEDYDGKVVIWSRFVEEIQHLHERLTKKGINAVKFLGSGMKDEDREAAKVAFRDDPKVKCFIGQIRSGGIGLNGLTVAQVALYLSNDFSLESRIQSEDRIHRIGQGGMDIAGKSSVLIVDILTDTGNDRDIYEALKEGKNYTDVINERMKA